MQKMRFNAALNVFAFCFLASLQANDLSQWQIRMLPEKSGEASFVPPNDTAKQGVWNLRGGGQKATLQLIGEEILVDPVPKQYDITFQASADINAEATVSFSMLCRNTGESVAKPLQPPLASSVTAVPGQKQKLTLTVTLDNPDAAGIKVLIPVLSVNDITHGHVSIDGFTVTAAEASGAVAVQPRQLPGYQAAAQELPQFFWAAPISYDKFAKMLDYAALGLHIITLTPEHLRGGFQWPDGSVVVAEYTAQGWNVQSAEGNAPLQKGPQLKAKNIEMACYGSGVIVREQGSAEGHNIAGGLHAGEIVLLRAKDAEAAPVKNLEIYPSALKYCFLDEAAKSLQNARLSWQANAAALKDFKLSERAWNEKFSFYQDSLDEAFQQVIAATDGFLPLIIRDSLLRDRYNHLVWMANNEFASKGGYFGGGFRRLWFSHLGGHPLVQSIQQFERKVRAAISRARRLTGASFKEGMAFEQCLSAAWCDALTQVPRRAGMPGPLTREGQLRLARQERESIQLVLSAGNQPVQDCSVEITTAEAGGLSVKTYLVDYIWLTESSNPQLPLREPGESEFPDILEPLKADQKFSIGAYENRAVWLTFYAAEDAAAGNREFTAQVKINGKTVMQTACQVKVANFAMGANRLENMIGMRFSTMRQFYGNADYKKSRRNLMLELLEHQMNPLDLYAQTPPEEDVEWALENGLSAINLGGNLNALAYPDKNMLKFIRLYGSTDGLTFAPIAANFSLRPRDPERISDHDLIVEPRESTAAFRYLKVHNAETRGWYDRCLYAFFVMYPRLGKTVEARSATDEIFQPDTVFYLQPDENPLVGKPLDDEKQPSSFAFDNLRNESNRSSVIIDLKNAQEIRRLRLINRSLENASKSLQERLDTMRKLSKGKVDIYLYGFDETGTHLNQQLKSALENARQLLPGVRLITTAANPQALPELYASLDVHCPANAYALPRHDRMVKEKYGVDFWTYVGGGGYYPFGNFERIDQPLIHSRAFFWEPIAFNHIKGFLYWDIQMWRKNQQFAENLPPVWSEWDSTHGENNGMGALFYPGPDCTSWPSMRAEVMRDGIEDYNFTRLAEELLDSRQFANADEKAKAMDKLQQIKDGFSTGMSVFCQDAKRCHELRDRLMDLIEQLHRLPH